jgi:exodeoxyribonuclease V alpha subunit
MTRPPNEVLAGLVERVTFHNAENGFCVLRIKARGHRDLVTVVGHAASISAGAWITASGGWTNDPVHGQQFRAAFLKTSAPSSAEGIEKYLGSGMIRGIGPVYARRLVQRFGTDVFDVIEADSRRLREIDGIGPKRAARIASAWADQKVIREIMVFLHSHGVGTARAVRIFKTYGADAVQVMSENPYRLAKDIRGIGFRTADAIARKLGIASTATIRLRAGIAFALTEAMGDGHCGLPREALIGLAGKLLEVPADLIAAALALERAEGNVTADTLSDTPCVFLTGLHQAERSLSGHLKRIGAGPLPWQAIDADRALPWIEEKTGMTLADTQAAAVRMALASKVLVITGGPGVGKTTIVNAILRILAAKGVRIRLCAPTGLAAKRMTEATGMEARTIHRLLEFDPKSFGFRHDEDSPLDCDLLVIDESSMVDVPLMLSLLRAVPATAALLIVGDTDQPPSVGPGQVLADIIASGTVPVMRLTEVFRQAAQSRIITSAHRINAGRIPDLSLPDGDSDFYFVPAEQPEQAAARIVHMVKHRIPDRFGFDPVRDIQVLCPMNRGGAGARALNIALQAALNPAGPRKVARFGWTFVPGDPGVGISRHRHPGHDPALRHAAAQPALYRHHPGQEARGAERTAQGHRHRGPQRLGTLALVETPGMARRARRPLIPVTRAGCMAGLCGPWTPLPGVLGLSASMVHSASGRPSTGAWRSLRNGLGQGGPKTAPQAGCIGSVPVRRWPDRAGKGCAPAAG